MKTAMKLLAYSAVTVYTVILCGTALAQSSKIPVGRIALTANPAVPTASVPAVATVTLDQTKATGLVALLDGEEVVGTGSVANGVATVKLPSENQPKHPLVVVYSGDGDYAASTTAEASGAGSKVTFGENGQPPITLVSEPTVGHEKEFATYTATLPDKAATGLVLYVLDGVFVGSAPVVNGSVTLVRGIGNMHIIYTGDDTHSPVSL